MRRQSWTLAIAPCTLKTIRDLTILRPIRNHCKTQPSGHSGMCMISATDIIDLQDTTSENTGRQMILGGWNGKLAYSPDFRTCAIEMSINYEKDMRLFCNKEKQIFFAETSKEFERTAYYCVLLLWTSLSVSITHYRDI